MYFFNFLLTKCLSMYLLYYLKSIPVYIYFFRANWMIPLVIIPHLMKFFIKVSKFSLKEIETETSTKKNNERKRKTCIHIRNNLKK